MAVFFFTKNITICIYEIPIESINFFDFILYDFGLLDLRFHRLD